MGAHSHSSLPAKEFGGRKGLYKFKSQSNTKGGEQI